MLRKDAHLAEKKYMLRIPLGRERVASDSLFPFGMAFPIREWVRFVSAYT